MLDQERGEREETHLCLVTAKMGCPLLRDLDLGRETRGYATVGVDLYKKSGCGRWSLNLMWIKFWPSERDS